MKKAIVTGATGFIGRFLVRELVSQGVQVFAVVRKNSRNKAELESLPVQIVECDITGLSELPNLIPDRDIDAVFHIAWQGVSDADAKNQSIQMGNLLGTLDLIDAINEMKVGTFVGDGRG